MYSFPSWPLNCDGSIAQKMRVAKKARANTPKGRRHSGRCSRRAKLSLCAAAHILKKRATRPTRLWLMHHLQVYKQCVMRLVTVRQAARTPGSTGFACTGCQRLRWLMETHNYTGNQQFLCSLSRAIISEAKRNIHAAIAERRSLRSASASRGLNNIMPAIPNISIYPLRVRPVVRLPVMIIYVHV